MKVKKKKSRTTKITDWKSFLIALKETDPCNVALEMVLGFPIKDPEVLWYAIELPYWLMYFIECRLGRLISVERYPEHFFFGSREDQKQWLCNDIRERFLVKSLLPSRKLKKGEVSYG